MRIVHRFLPVLSVVVLLLLFAVPTSASAQPELAPGPAPCSLCYVVKHGDTLNKIAARYGTTVSYLVWLNGIKNPDYIRSGQTLCIQGAPQPACGSWYTVKRGDTLTKIGQRTGWSAAYLAKINGVPCPDYIWAGQRLWIPCH